ncbi:MAG: TraR/DksA C4-type zinc finger protein [Chitinophagaceae bacterium]|nr:TraR/DksA C4-type zinc finger protein [Chitinophagaceae bacterium]
MAAKKKLVKTVAKKPVQQKKGAKTVTKVPAKKPVSKNAAAKKTVIKPAAKKASPSKKQAKPILKSAPVKKAVAPVAKKSVHSPGTTAQKNLKTPDKKIKQVAKTLPAVKKPAATPPQKTLEVKKSIQKTVAAKINSKPLPKAKVIKIQPAKPLVLPKFATTKSRRYEPEFTKSVLDQAPYVSNGPTMRYSDGELKEFRELIQRKLETAKKELGYLQGLITRKDEMGGDETDNRYMTMEDGSLSMEREQLSQMASRQITFIDHLEKAMIRIENKTYGICRVTGKLIDKARLRAVPHATLSIEAKMGTVR